MSTASIRTAPPDCSHRRLRETVENEREVPNRLSRPRTYSNEPMLQRQRRESPRVSRRALGSEYQEPTPSEVALATGFKMIDAVANGLSEVAVSTGIAEPITEPVAAEPPPADVCAICLEPLRPVAEPEGVADIENPPAHPRGSGVDEEQSSAPDCLSSAPDCPLSSAPDCPQAARVVVERKSSEPEAGGAPETAETKSSVTALEGDDAVCCPRCRVVAGPCGHEFHEACVNAWLEKKNTCPLCRTLWDPKKSKDGTLPLMDFFGSASLCFGLPFPDQNPICWLFTLAPAVLAATVTTVLFVLEVYIALIILLIITPPMILWRLNDFPGGYPGRIGVALIWPGFIACVVVVFTLAWPLWPLRYIWRLVTYQTTIWNARNETSFDMFRRILTQMGEF